MSDQNGLTIDYLPCGNNGSATLTARLGGDILGHEKVDLAKPDARSRFVADLVKARPSIDASAVERELLRIGADLTERRAQPADKPAAPDSSELLAKMPEQVRAEARAMLEADDLFVRTCRDVAALGVAGEEMLVGTIILVGTSRLLQRPLAAIVQAPSSTGKSFVVEKTSTIFPPEAVIHATSMTAQALFYLEPGELRHRFIVAGERSRKEDDDTAEATRALREMIGSGRLTKLVAVKEGGRIVTQKIEQDGPIAYVETTTLAKIFEEDANRCLLVSADERSNQTRAVVERIAAGYSASTVADTEAIVQKHYAAQRMLQSRPVYIPFADRIAAGFDCERVEARRGIGHFLSMIAASAIFHQFQRQIDGDGRIVATAADYGLARLLCQGPLARLLGGRLSDAALRFHDRLTGWATAAFSTSEAAKRDRKTTQAIRGWLTELTEAGAIEQVEPARGNRPARWKLLPIDKDELAAGDCGLPSSINEVCAK